MHVYVRHTAPSWRVCTRAGVLYARDTTGLAVVCSPVGGIHVGGPLCVFLCVLSWLNSCSTETNYNEARLVGRESAMFSFLRSLPLPSRSRISPSLFPRFLLSFLFPLSLSLSNTNWSFSKDTLLSARCCRWEGEIENV